MLRWDGGSSALWAHLVLYSTFLFKEFEERSENSATSCRERFISGFEWNLIRYLKRLIVIFQLPMKEGKEILSEWKTQANEYMKLNQLKIEVKIFIHWMDHLENVKLFRFNGSERWNVYA